MTTRIQHVKPEQRDPCRKTSFHPVRFRRQSHQRIIRNYLGSVQYPKSTKWGLPFTHLRNLVSRDIEHLPVVWCPSNLRASLLFACFKSVALDLLVVPFWSTLSHGPKRLTLYFWILWATEFKLGFFGIKRVVSKAKGIFFDQTQTAMTRWQCWLVGSLT